MQLAEAPTPQAVVDRGKVARNTQRMSARVRDAGIDLRPHMKTAKSIEVARLATAGHSGAITVSTVTEAEYFAAHGVRDMTYAVCAVPDKLDRLNAVQTDHGAVVRLITDNVDIADALAHRAQILDARFRMLIEIDSGEHRTGIPWDAGELLEIGHRLHSASNLELDGVLTHGGHSYECTSAAEIQTIAEQERSAVVQAAQRLRSAGLPCPTVSAGSTPTAVHAASFEGLTEIRPGVYVFYDLAQLGRGSCQFEDIALSVVATVISHQPRHGRLVIDAGGLALSKDTSAGTRLADAGYGWVTDLEGVRIGDLRVITADQEHGYVAGSQVPFERLPVGARVRVVPNHACMTAAAYDRYLVVDGGQQVETTWLRTGGWRQS
jgi:D-serine deaminase-like pyridoxal phosphate-dependent protein